jgi:hypothetical protein
MFVSGRVCRATVLAAIAVTACMTVHFAAFVFRQGFDTGRTALAAAIQNDVYACSAVKNQSSHYNGKQICKRSLHTFFRKIQLQRYFRKGMNEFCKSQNIPAFRVNSNGRARHPGKLLCFQQREQETGRFMQLACHPVIPAMRVHWIASPCGFAMTGATI